MKILILEPFYSGSHKTWIDGLKSTLEDHEIDLLGLSGKHWKWRMQAGAISLAKRFLESEKSFDLILATDMLNLPLFMSLAKEKLYKTKIAVYFHENQFSYPISQLDTDKIEKRDNHYGFMNYTSSLVSDALFFNSSYHLNDYFSRLDSFLKKMPDTDDFLNISKIRDKSSVLYPGLNLSKFDQFKFIAENEIPHVLWNHRWEYDKNPIDFLDSLLYAKKQGVEFKLILLGKRGVRKFPQLDELADEVVFSGYSESFEDYAQQLWKSDIVFISSIQENFGFSLIEAMYCKSIPLAPNRLVYSEHFDTMKENMYSEENKIEKLLYLLKNYKAKNRNKFRSYAAQYDWKKMGVKYRSAFNHLIN